MMHTLLDELSSPRLRVVIGGLLASADRAEIAVAHVRLGALDLSERETGAVTHCRILLGRLDAASFATPALAETDPARLRALVRFVASDRVEIRSAGMGAWYPDFSIYRGVRDGTGSVHDVALLGAHYFRDPVTAIGPSLSCVLTDTFAIALALRRFDALWERSHDVREPVLHAIRQFGAGEAVVPRAGAERPR